MSVDFLYKVVIFIVHACVLSYVLLREEPAICSGLWRGIDEPIDIDPSTKVHLVVAYCVTDPLWIHEWSEGFQFESVTVYSKCGKTPAWTPDNALIVTLPNVGREGYAWVHHMISVRNAREVKDDDIVFLMKDSFGKKYHYLENSSFSRMLRTASSPLRFACGALPQKKKGFNPFLTYRRGEHSMWHDTRLVLDTEQAELNTEYESLAINYSEVSDAVPFASNVSMANWVRSVNVSFPSPIMPVCYTGNFATQASRIRGVPEPTLHLLHSSLSRGSNIQEGGYAELTFAALLVPRLADKIEKRIRDVSRKTCKRCAMKGIFFGCTS